MTPDLGDVAEKLIAMAQKAGADAADALVAQGVSINVDVRKGTLEQAERSDAIDVGLRVLLGQKQAIVSASDLRDGTLLQIAERAVAMAHEASDDPFAGLADPDSLATHTDHTGLELYDPAPEPAPDTLVDMARDAEAAALAVKGVTQVQSASAGYGVSRIHLAATNGFSGGYSRTDTGLSCVTIAGQGAGMERDHDWDSRIYASDLRTPSEIGRTAATRAIERLSPRKPKTGHFPVLFDERLSSSLIGHLLSAINGAMVARGSSWLLDAMDQQILPTSLSLFEEPHRSRVSQSRLFDGEGLATRMSPLVENGILSRWVLDLRSARKLGLESTANAGRGHSGPPSPSVGNLTLTPGENTRADLIRDMGTGLLVTSLIGSTINPNTGDYSRGASGFWIEGGEIQYPVNECTIAGNLREMLRSMIAANDGRPHLSRVIPSLLVPGMTIAGN